MRIHFVQHASFETPGIITDWARKKKYSINSTMLYNNEHLPDINDFDLLVIMGGPMNVYEEDRYDFLNSEKKFIENCIRQNKKIIGICLGAQIIACVLGAKITRNKFKEIGWHRVKITPDVKKMKLFDHFPDDFIVFHWHGDMFDIPSNSIKIFSSDACYNQGFIYNENIVAMQFHPEVDKGCIKNFIRYNKAELVESQYVQSEKEIISNLKYVRSMNKYLEEFLEKF